MSSLTGIALGAVKVRIAGYNHAFLKTVLAGITVELFNSGREFMTRNSWVGCVSEGSSVGSKITSADTAAQYF